MVGPQHLIRVPGLLMVIFAVIGSILVGSDLTEGPVTMEQKVFLISWATGMESIPSGSGTTNDGGSAIERVDLNIKNLTAVTFKVTWQDNARLSGRYPATVTITVTDPNGTVRGEDSGSSGTTGVSVSVGGLNAPYEKESIKAMSEEEAQRTLSEECPPQTNGMGEWEVMLSVQRDFPFPMGRRSIDWAMICDIIQFHAVLGEDGPENG